MQFTFHNRGDLFLLTNYHTESIRVGDLVVFAVKDRDMPIVHRVIRVHERLVNSQFFNERCPSKVLLLFYCC